MSLHRKTSWLAASILVLTALPSAGQVFEDMQLFAPARMDQFGGGARANEGFFFSYEALNWWVKRPDVSPLGNPNIAPQRVFYRESVSKMQFTTVDTSWLDEERRFGNRFELGNVRGHHGWSFSFYEMNDKNQDFVASNADLNWRDVPAANGRGFLWGPAPDVTTNPPTTGADYLGTTTIDPISGSEVFLRLPLPNHFDEIVMRNHQEIWNTEINYIYRLHPTWHGSQIELMAGVRYMEFDETFSVVGTGEPYLYIDPLTGLSSPNVVGPNTILADSYWDTTADNHIVGPQIMLHWRKKWDRLTLLTESKFFSGINYQNIHQKGELGSRLNELPPVTVTATQPDPANPTLVVDTPYRPLTSQPVGFTHVEHNTEFSPGLEFKAEAKVQLTRALSIGAGYNFMFIDGIARASNMVDYSIVNERIVTLNEQQQEVIVEEPHVLGINNWNNREDVYMHGPSFKIELNR